MDFTNLTVSNLKQKLQGKNKISNSWIFQAMGEGYIADLNNLFNFY